MTCIITPRAMRRYTTAQLNVTDDDQVDLFIDERFDFFSAFVIFLNTNIHYLCSSLRKPGGTIVDPENSNETIIYLGSTVRYTTEMKLKLAFRIAAYFVNVSRNPKAINIAWSYVRKFSLLEDKIEKHQPPQALILVSSSFTMVKWVEHFEKYLRGVLGVDEIPLTYIIRLVQAIPTIVKYLIVAGGAPYRPPKLCSLTK